MNAIAPERLQTTRLEIERLGLVHEPELAGLSLDPRVYRTLWPWADPPTADDVRLGLDEMLEHWRRHGFGLWRLGDRLTGEFVGRGGLQYTHAPGRRAVEVAWAVVPERWGEGLATELARAAVDVAFGPLGLTELIAITLPDNLASRRVMEKAGFVYDRDIEHVGLGHVLYLWVPDPGSAPIRGS